MMDIAHKLNANMRTNPMWRKLAEAVEDLINTTVGAATDESMSAIGSSQRFSRGDTVDPRSMPDITPASGDGLSYQEILDGRERKATVQVVLPTDDKGGAQVYLELDGTTYVANHNRFHDRALLIQEAKHLGFDFFSDDLDDADYARVLSYISQYWPRSGAKGSLGNFLGFIRDIRIDLVQLWTLDNESEDYDVLERFNNSMTPVWEGGTHYPTYIYDMYFDAFDNTDIKELERLFYAMAPIHLVLRRMVETIRSSGQAYATAAPLLSSGRSLIWNPQEAKGYYRKVFVFVDSVLNVALPLVPPNLQPNGLAISATGAYGIWILERDPALMNPANPALWMKEHGFYIPPSASPSDRFDFPMHGIWNGVWVMAEIANTGCIIEVT